MLQSLFKSLAFKPIVATMIGAFLSLTVHAAPNAEKVIVKPGTAVRLMTEQIINSENLRSGQTLQFKVVDDVKANGKVVISKGSVANAQVIEASGGRLMGIKGNLAIQVKDVTAVDGTTILLSNGNLNAQGKQRLAPAIILTWFCIFGFLIHGGDAIIPANTIIDASIMSETEIDLK